MDEHDRPTGRNQDGRVDNEQRFGFGKSILYSTIIVATILICAELSIRTWAYFFRGEYERYDTVSQTFVLVPGQHRVGRNLISINRDGFIGNELQPDGPDLFRILALGDSCTFGDGDRFTTYPAVLEKQLQAGLGHRSRYEIVNGGVEGLNSEMALRRLRTKGPSLSPDIVTIYIGWNDLMKFDPLGQQDIKRWSRVVRVIDKLWLTKALRKLVFYYVRPILSPPAVGPQSRTGRFKAFRPTFYEENLRALIATARSLGARPVLLTLPTVVRDDMTVQDLREANVVFPYYASTYGVGDLLDLLAAYNRSIRRVSTEQQVPLIDLARVFSKFQDVRPLFYDTMHPNRKGRELIAGELRSGLERAGLLEAVASTATISGPNEK